MKDIEVPVIWQSDCNGYELGYDDVSVIGIYMSAEDNSILYYVDTENMKILEVLKEWEMTE